MENIVVELSRYNTVDTNGNSEWTNHLSKNIKIEPGDSIVVKQCFIDTRLIDNTSILIEEDIEWTLYFIYWVNGHGINQIVYNSDADKNYSASIPDGLPYCLATIANPTAPSGMTVLNPYPLTDKKVVKIPKGTYERNYLATFITKQFESTKNPENVSLSSLRFGNAQGFPVYAENIAGSFPTTFTDLNIVDDPTKVVTPFIKPLLCCVADGEPGEIAFPILFLYLDNQGNYKPAILNPFLNSVNGAYEYGSGQLLILNGDELKKDYDIGGSNYTVYDGGYIGSTEIALVYNDESSGKFSFQYLHSPLVNDGNETTSIFTRTVSGSTNPPFQSNKVAFCGAYSGIMFVETFTNLTPKDASGNYLYNEDPFFQQLGMNYNDIVPADAKNLFVNDLKVGQTQFVEQGAILQDDFLSHTTKNFLSTGGLIDQSKTTTIGNYKITNYQSIYGFSSYSFMDSQITDEIYFSNVPVSSTTNAGHYLVDIQAYDNTYVNDNELYSIKATVSNFYLSGDSFTSTLGPDPYIYTHQGVPISLSSIKVRILNPITKENADNVGDNSTIYLQVYKAQQKLQVEPEKKEDEKKEQKD